MGRPRARHGPRGRSGRPAPPREDLRAFFRARAGCHRRPAVGSAFLASVGRERAPAERGVCWRARGPSPPASALRPVARNVDSLENCAAALEAWRLIDGKPALGAPFRATSLRRRPRHHLGDEPGAASAIRCFSRISAGPWTTASPNSSPSAAALSRRPATWWWSGNSSWPRSILNSYSQEASLSGGLRLYRCSD